MQQSALAALRLELAELRETVDNQGLDIARLRRELASLRLAPIPAGGSGSDSRANSVAGSVAGSDSRDSRAAPASPLRTPSESGYSDGSYSVVSVGNHPTSLPRSTGAGTTASSAQGSLSWVERERIADQIGSFFRRSVEGTHRGTSGRDRNPLASRVWVVIRDYAGQIYEPVRVFRNWTPCKTLVKPGNITDPADSIFCGFPSEREARRAVEVGGFTWPSVIEA